MKPSRVTTTENGFRACSCTPPRTDVQTALQRDFRVTRPRLQRHDL